MVLKNLQIRVKYFFNAGISSAYFTSLYMGQKFLLNTSREILVKYSRIKRKMIFNLNNSQLDISYSTEKSN